MNEDDFDDELPAICVNSTRDSDGWAMPSAGQVASQRETERSCERELRMLRAQHEAAGPGPGPALALPARSDSSGSEGEAALAAAVTALRVAAEPSKTPKTQGAAPFLAALLPRLPPAAAGPALALQRALAADARARRASLRRVVRGATAALAGARTPWPDGACLGVGGAMCGALLAGAPGARAALRRLLDERASPSAAEELARLAADAAPEPRTRLRLADAARGGPPDGGAALFAAGLERRTLRELLRPTDDGAAEAEAPGRLLAFGAPAPLPAAALAAAVAVAGRALAALPPPDERERLLRGLAALARAPPAPGDERPSRLKVAVSASALQLLLRAPP